MGPTISWENKLKGDFIMKKKVFAILLACVLAVGLSVSAFAAGISVDSNAMIPYGPLPADENVYLKFFLSGYSHQKMLNLEGEGDIYPNRDVTVYTETNSTDQVWTMHSVGDSCYRIYSARADRDGGRYTLNVHRGNGNCNVYRDIASNMNDSKVRIDGNADGCTIRLQMTSRTDAGVNLDYLRNPTGRDVRWNGQGHPEWKYISAY